MNTDEMSAGEFADGIRSRYHAPAAEGHDIHIAFVSADERIALHVAPGVTADALMIEDDAAAAVTFTFSSWRIAFEILTGAYDPIRAFMAGDFRSDGYLPVVFLVLAMFRSGGIDAPE